MDDYFLPLEIKMGKKQLPWATCRHADYEGKCGNTRDDRNTEVVYWLPISQPENESDRDEMIYRGVEKERELSDSTSNAEKERESSDSTPNEEK